MSYKKPVFKETHQTIAEQTRSYLKSGGKIEEVPAGYTGQAKLADKQKHYLASSTGLPAGSLKKPGINNH